MCSPVSSDRHANAARMCLADSLAEIFACARTVSTAATGTIGSLGIPLYDLAFSTFLPNTFTGPEAPMGATCANPPLIDFTGEVDRCISAAP